MTMNRMEASSGISDSEDAPGAGTTLHGEGCLTDREPIVRLLSASILAGCNIYHDKTVIRQEVELCGGAQSGWAKPDFAARFTDRFDRLRTFNNEGAINESFLDLLQSGQDVPVIEALFQAILAIETSMAFAMRDLEPTTFAKIIPGRSANQAFLVWSSNAVAVSRRSAQVGLLGLQELLYDASGTGRSLDSKHEFAPAYRALRKKARRLKNLPPGAVLIHAAKKRQIPCEMIGGQLVRLGQGKFQHHIWSTHTSKTSRVADKLSQDKSLTNRVLGEIGLPVPRQFLAASIGKAVDGAADLGYPIAVKPLDGNTGKGVSAGLMGPDEIPAAFERARRHGSAVIVETFVEGQDHRLLVVNGQLVGAAIRLPPSVTGNGRRTITELVHELNRDPLRDNFWRVQVKFDEEFDRLLEKAGYGRQSVLAEGEKFVLRATANISTGGWPMGVMDDVHSDNRIMAIRAAQAIGLDVAGIDFITTDIARSYKENGGSILEVNSRPGLRPLASPIDRYAGKAADAVVETMFSPGETGRVPTAIVLGKRQLGSRVVQGLDTILRASGLTVGFVNREGAFVDGEQVRGGDAKRWRSSRSVLRDPRVEAFIHSVSARQVVGRGLAHDLCEVAAVLDTAGDDKDAAEARQGLDVVIRATRGLIVVAARSAMLPQIVGAINPDRLILVATDPADTDLGLHVDVGGRAVLGSRNGVEDKIAFVEDRRTVASFCVDAAPANAEEASQQQEVLLFAVALALGMGLTHEAIMAALSQGQNN